MSVYAAKLLSIEYEELLEFLSKPKRGSHVVGRPRQDDSPSKGGNNSTFIASVCLFSFAFILFALTVGVFFYARKKMKKMERGMLFQVDIPSEAYRSPSVSSAGRQSLPHIFDPPRTMDRINESRPIDEDELRKLHVESLDIDANFYTYRNFLRVKIQRVDLSNISQVVRDGTFIYIIVVVEVSGNTFDSAYYETDMHPVAEQNYFDDTPEFDLTQHEISSTLLKLSVFVTNRYSQHQLVNKYMYTMGTNSDENSPDKMKSVQMVTLTQTSRSADNEVGLRILKTPEVLFSLCYMPTSGRLTFVAIKARNIQTDDKSNTKTHLQVSLMVSGRTMKIVQTTGAKMLCNPVYNEAFVFSIPLEKVAETQIVASLCKTSENSNINESILGQAIVGQYSPSNIGRKHWLEMLASPRRPVAQWHSISEVLL